LFGQRGTERIGARTGKWNTMLGNPIDLGTHSLINERRMSPLRRGVSNIIL
jgi:hypothetical protein